MVDESNSGHATNPASGVEKATEAFEAALSVTDGTQEPAERKPRVAKPAEAPVAEAQSSDEADETATDEELAALDEDDEDQEGGEAKEEDQADDEEQPAVDPKTYKVTVKIDGKAEEVTLEEAVNGYQRGKDYARKTEAISHERKALQAEIEQVRNERAQYSQLLPALEQQLQAVHQDQAIDWDALWTQNPTEWVRQRELAKERTAKIEAAQIEQYRLQQAAQGEQQQALQEHVSQQREALTEAIPAWKDKTRWDKDRVALREYGKKLGFTDDELSAAYDHRAVVALYKAMRYDKITSQRTPAPDPRAAAPTAKPGARSTSTKPVAEATRAKMRLAKTGKVADLAKVFEGLI